jgi:hypothetical protein
LKKRCWDLIKKSLSEFKERVRNRVGLAIVGAFALVIALAWNEAIKAVVYDILAHFNVAGTTYYYQLAAALLTTVICVAGIMYFSRWSEAKK